MKIEHKVKYSLTEKEVREAVYDFYVNKFRDYGISINGIFSPDDIMLENNTAELHIFEERDGK